MERTPEGEAMAGQTATDLSSSTLDQLARQRQHPGFVLLDSPLLAYRAPEGPEDDLRGTDVQDKFYEYLAAASERQVLVIENTTPPEAIARRPSTTFFSKNPHQGRYGFFPLPPGEPSTSAPEPAKAPSEST